MNNHKKGLKYEDFVEEVYQSIWKNESINGNMPSHVKLEKRKKIKTLYDDTAELDIYWEFYIAQSKITIVMECKDWNDTVGVKEIRDFNHKTQHLGCRSILVSKNKVSSEVLKVAKKANIEIIEMREPKDGDWKNGIQKIEGEIIVNLPAELVSIEPTVDKDWAVQEGYNKDNFPYQCNAQNNEIIILNNGNNLKASVYELQQNNFYISDAKYGLNKWNISGDNCWICFNDTKLKIKNLIITFKKLKPIKRNLSIDLKDSVKAIQTYPNKNNEKKAILHTGEIKDFS